MPHHFCVFGLSVRSDLDCPELFPAAPMDEPDIVFRYTAVPRTLEHAVTSRPTWQAAPGRFLIHVEGLGSFHVLEGREIHIQPQTDVSEHDIRLFLLSACLSILMHQRRMFVLHCSGIATERGAVLFAGKSGAGKSTMVSAFLDRGYRILADDMLTLTFDDAGRVIALPGFPQVKLWADSARALGRSTEGLRRVTPADDKFIAPEKERFSSQPAPLSAIYDLQVADALTPNLEPLSHTPRFHILLDHTWQKATLSGLGVREWHFQAAARIASLTYAARLTRPPKPLDIRRTADLIEADMLADHTLA